jgi:hypothetical protein
MQVLLSGNDELKKHVATVHSNNKLSLLQRKIANALLFNAYPQLMTANRHSINISVLCCLIGYDSHDHQTIKTALVNLLATVIEWNLVDGDKLNKVEGIWNASSMIADATIEGSVCTYSYSEKMRELLFRPEMYARLSMVVQAKFRSTYALALYENCMRYESLSKTPWFPIATFRKLMGLEDSTYTVHRDLKHRVVARAVKEVNEHAPIMVTPEFKHPGKAGGLVRFHIEQKPPVDMTEIIGPKKSLSEYLLQNIRLTPRQCESVLTHYEESYIHEKIELIQKSSSYTQGKIKSIKNYFLAALKYNYQENTTQVVKKTTTSITTTTRHTMQSETSKQETELNGLPHPPSKVGKTTETLPKIISTSKTGGRPTNRPKKAYSLDMLDEYTRYHNKLILEYYLNMEEAVKTKFLVGFEKYLRPTLYMYLYEQSGTNDLLVQDQLCYYFRNFQPGYIQDLPDYQTFRAQQEEEGKNKKIDLKSKE